MRPGGNGPDPETELAEEEILFPFREVTLFGPGGKAGDRVLVKAWDIDTGARMTLRLISLEQKIASELGREATLPQVIDVARPELQAMVCDTVGWSDADFRQKVHTYEEFLALVEAMWATSIMRPGGGALPLILKLLDATTEALVAANRTTVVALASRRRSTSSSVPDIPSPTSGG